MACLLVCRIRAEQAHKRYYDEAHRDILTGLGNRRAFDRDLTRALDRREPFVLALIDLDDFKAFNDAYGHLAGDRALSAFGTLLRTHARSTDLQYRYGGDEMALILPHTKRAEASPILKRLVAVAEENAYRFSFGLAGYPEDGRTVHELVAAADRQLYAAKGRVDGGSDAQRPG